MNSRSLVRATFVIAVLIALGAFVWQSRVEIGEALYRLPLSGLLLSLLAAGGFALSSFGAWKVLIDRNGATLSIAQAARIYFLGQIGKYIPGGIWQFLASAELGRTANLSRASTVSSFVFALAASLTAGSAVVLLTMPEALPNMAISPLWFFGLAAVPFAILLSPAFHKLCARFGKGDGAPPRRRLTAAFALSLITWLFGGLHIWLLARGIGVPLGLGDLAPLAGCYAAAWMAGFLIMIAPAGMGAREGTLVALLSLTMAVPEAVTIALLSRILATLVDVLAAGMVLALTRGPPLPPAASPPLRG